MFGFLRRKPTTVLDVISGPDEAYNDLLSRGLVRKSIPAAELIARLNDEAVAR